jgi:hypothetical protein
MGQIDKILLHNKIMSQTVRLVGVDYPYRELLLEPVLKGIYGGLYRIGKHTWMSVSLSLKIFYNALGKCIKLY